MGYRWHTSDLHIAITDISALFKPWQQGLHPSKDEISVTCLYSRYDCWLHVVIYCKLFTSQEFLKGSTGMEVAGPHNSNWACKCLELGDEDHSAYSSDLMPSDFHLFGPLEKQLGGKWFASDTDKKQAATSWLQIFQTSFWCNGIKALVHGGTNIEMWMLTVWMSDVYHLLPGAMYTSK